MTEEKLEKYRNGLDYVMDSPVIKYILIGATIIALIYSSGILMQLVATVVLSYKTLKSAINKPA